MIWALILKKIIHQLLSRFLKKKTFFLFLQNLEINQKTEKGNEQGELDKTLPHFP